MRRGYAVALAIALFAVSPAAEVCVGVAHADTTIAVGDVLQALEDVELDEAIVARGSKISVSQLKRSGGATLFDVTLADGHVVRSVPQALIARSFRLVPQN